MPTMIEMVEAHLMNVQREMNTLVERKNAIEQEIQKLQKYLNDGVSVLNEAKAAATKPITSESLTQKSLF